MCALLALNTASAANEVSRHDLALKDASISDSLVQLNNEVAASAAPQNLAAAAANLGMVPGGNPAFLVIGSDGKVKLLGNPAPAVATPAYMPPATPTPTPTPTPSTSTSTSTSKSSTSKAAKATHSSSKAGKATSRTTKAATSATSKGGHVTKTTKSAHVTKKVAATHTAPATIHSTLLGGTR
jgi:hypothetical protein